MSTKIIVRPMLTLLTFETIAATMSVPPVEPLWIKTIPTLTPHNIAPRTALIDMSSIRGCPRPIKKDSNMPIKREATVAPNIVRNTKVRPTILNASASRIKLHPYCETATGITPLVAKYTSVATPDTPPITIPCGSMNAVNAMP
jgi:hypothetical protein